MRFSIYVFAAAGLVACGGANYVYSPQTANAVIGGLPASRTPIPQERPQGNVEIASRGIADLQPGDGRVPALHVRMIVTNDGDETPWRLDTREQIVEIQGEGRSAPMYVNANVNTTPNVTVPLRERRVIDLYYPLPTTISRAKQLPRFEVLWEVDTGSRTVSSRTAFERIEIQEPEMYTYDPSWSLYAGYGPHWWYDPFYSRTVFVHSRPIVIRDRSPVVHRYHGSFRPSPAVTRSARARR
jgi:hypothetical protein